MYCCFLLYSQIFKMKLATATYIACTAMQMSCVVECVGNTGRVLVALFLTRCIGGIVGQDIQVAGRKRKESWLWFARWVPVAGVDSTCWKRCSQLVVRWLTF